MARLTPSCVFFAVVATPHPFPHCFTPKRSSLRHLTPAVAMRMRRPSPYAPLPCPFRLSTLDISSVSKENVFYEQCRCGTGANVALADEHVHRAEAGAAEASKAGGMKPDGCETAAFVHSSQAANRKRSLAKLRPDCLATTCNNTRGRYWKS